MLSHEISQYARLSNSVKQNTLAADTTNLYGVSRPPIQAKLQNKNQAAQSFCITFVHGTWHYGLMQSGKHHWTKTLDKQCITTWKEQHRLQNLATNVCT